MVRCVTSKVLRPAIVCSTKAGSNGITSGNRRAVWSTGTICSISINAHVWSPSPRPLWTTVCWPCAKRSTIASIPANGYGRANRNGSVWSRRSKTSERSISPTRSSAMSVCTWSTGHSSTRSNTVRISRARKVRRTRPRSPRSKRATDNTPLFTNTRRTWPTPMRTSSYNTTLCRTSTTIFTTCWTRGQRIRRFDRTCWSLVWACTMASERMPVRTRWNTSKAISPEWNNFSWATSVRAPPSSGSANRI